MAKSNVVSLEDERNRKENRDLRHLFSREELAELNISSLPIRSQNLALNRILEFEQELERTTPH